MVGGYGVLTFVIVTVMAPTAVRIVEIVVRKLQHQHAFFGIADLVVFLVLNFSELAIAGYLAARSYRRPRSSTPSVDLMPAGALNTPAP
jgi:hypothetical protein